MMASPLQYIEGLNILDIDYSCEMKFYTPLNIYKSPVPIAGFNWETQPENKWRETQL